MSFLELTQFYKEHYSTGYLNPDSNDKMTSFERKLELISLICYITHKNKLKNPDITYYQVIMKLSQNLGLSEDFIKGLAIVCEDLAYGCNEFPTFNLKKEEILKEVRSILSTYMPF